MPENKPYLKSLLFFICLFLFSKAMNAQTTQIINGSVITAETAEPLEGVTISVENKDAGSVTNSEGKFVLVLHGDFAQADSVAFSYIGFSSQKISLNDASVNKNLVIKLKESITDLKEVSVKPLSLKSLLDNIVHHNKQAFASPVNLKGYYRETVYTNSKCSEYSDALCEYYFDKAAFPDGQFKINASRCLKRDNNDKHNDEVYNESFLGPNTAFKYAMFSGMISRFFPDKDLSKYAYDIKQSGDENAGNLKIAVSPKPGAAKPYYELTLNLKSDYTLQSYQLTIPDKFLPQLIEINILGIHIKKGKYNVNVNYTAKNNNIFPSFYTITRKYHVHADLLGTKVDEAVDDKTEFLVTEFDDSKGLNPFEKRDVYKKGNICNNGAAINDALLKNYTVIKLTQKDSSAMISLVRQ